MEKFFKKKYLIIVGIIVLIVILCILYFFKETKEVSYTNLDDLVKETEEVESSEITVEIKGEVLNPGVYVLNSNEIINNLIIKAGGLTENAYTDNINLSKILSNEMVIYIYKKSDFTKKTGSISNKSINSTCLSNGAYITNCLEDKESVIEVGEEKEEESSNSNSSKLININTASISELMTLNGIGEAKAKNIIEYREKSKFTKKEDITKVSGIGSSIYEKIKDNITI